MLIEHWEVSRYSLSSLNITADAATTTAIVQSSSQTSLQFHNIIASNVFLLRLYVNVSFTLSVQLS
jgi:hypothetical protein